jgi:glycosyltransferase involved in cell wall biosynthesis
LVIYEVRFEKNRFWSIGELHHPHHFIEECSSQRLLEISKQADLLIFSGYRNYQLRALMMFRQAVGKPWVFWGERMGFRIPISIGALYRRWCLRTLHRSSSEMWGIGSWAVEQYASEFGPDRKYANVPYCSKLMRFSAIDRSAELGRPRRLLFCGSLTHRKGFDILVSCIDELFRNRSDIELVVIGAGALSSQAFKLRQSYGSRVQIRGFLQPQDLPQAFAVCDVLCAPSRYDGWGMVVVEGMAAGMPVISTCATGAAIDLLDESCGWVIRPNDSFSLYKALETATDIDIEKLRKMGDNGRRRAQMLDVEAGTERFISAARRAMNAHPDSIHDRTGM